MDGASRNKAAFRSLVKGGTGKRDKRIEHPLARYDEVGHIECKVCKKSVETEGRWIAHLASKDHHESVSRLKAQLQGGGGANGKAAAVPTKPPLIPVSGVKRTGGALPSDFFDAPKAKQARADREAMPPPPMRPPAGQTSAAKPAAPIAGHKGASLAGGEGGGSAPRESPSSAGPARGAPALQARVGEAREAAPSLPPGKGELPPGFFDDVAEEAAARTLGNAGGGTAERAGRLENGGGGAAGPAGPSTGTAKGGAAAGALPEGFFDDETADKKARGVEIPKRDPAEEYREFQRSIQLDLDAAEKFQEEDEIVAAEEREERMAIENREFAEKIRELQRIKDGKKAEAAKASTSRRKVFGMEDNDDEEDEDEDEEDGVILDWRAKKT